MTDQNVALYAQWTSVDEAPAALVQEHPKPKQLSATDTVNWLRYLAKCKTRQSQISSGGNEPALVFQAHVMREAARHLESLKH
jgi:hypothetical protein